MYCTTTEVRRRASGGSGSGGSATVTALPEEELRSLIEQASRFFDLSCGVEPEYFESAYYPVWESNHVYVVGDIITPTTRNLHKYRVTTAGTSGATEPTFPTSSGGTVGTAPVFTEYGADVVATNKTVYGDGLNFLRLPPYVSGTLNTTLTLPTGYTAPEFIERDGYLLLSYSNVVVPFSNWSGWYSGVPITISAVWGFDGTPEDVKLAVIELVLNLWRESDPAQQKLVNLDGMALREKLPPRVAEIAKRYRAKGAVFV